MVAPLMARDQFADLLRENAELKIRISTLEADLRLRDSEIQRLRKPKPRTLDKAATDMFRRPA